MSKTSNNKEATLPFFFLLFFKFSTNPPEAFFCIQCDCVCVIRNADQDSSTLLYYILNI